MKSFGLKLLIVLMVLVSLVEAKGVVNQELKIPKFNNDTNLISVSKNLICVFYNKEEKKFTFYDLQNNKLIYKQVLDLHEFSGYDYEWHIENKQYISKDGRYFAYIFTNRKKNIYKTIRIIDLKNKMQLPPINFRTSSVELLGFSDDSKDIIFSYEKKRSIFDHEYYFAKFNIENKTIIKTKVSSLVRHIKYSKNKKFILERNKFYDATTLKTIKGYENRKEFDTQVIPILSRYQSYDRYLDLEQFQLSKNGNFYVKLYKKNGVVSVLDIVETISGTLLKRVIKYIDMRDRGVKNNEIIDSFLLDPNDQIITKISTIQNKKYISRYEIKDNKNFNTIKKIRNLSTLKHVNYEYIDNNKFIVLITKRRGYHRYNLIFIDTDDYSEYTYKFDADIMYIDSERIIFRYNKSLLLVIDFKLFDSDFAKKVYERLDKNNFIELGEFVEKFPSVLKVTHKAKEQLYNSIVKKDKTWAYDWFIKKFPNESYKVKNKKLELERKKDEEIFNKVVDSNNIMAYEGYIIHGKSYSSKMVLLDKSFQIIDKLNNIYGYLYFFELSKGLHKEKILNKISEIFFNKTKEIDTIDAYNTFITAFYFSNQAKEAKIKIYEIEFKKAKKLNTISAYNSFILKYPFASQVKKANELAYLLEKDKYTDIGFLSFFNKSSKLNKQARKIIINIKKILKKHNHSIGSEIIVHRMHKLLNEEFQDTDAFLAYSEEHDIDEFSKNLKNELSILNSVSSNNIKITKSLIKNAIQALKENKELYNFYNKEKENFRKYLKEHDEKGKNEFKHLIDTMQKDKNPPIGYIDKSIENFNEIYKLYKFNKNLNYNLNKQSENNISTAIQQKVEYKNNNNLFTYPNLQEVATQGNIDNGKKLINVCVGCHSLTSQGIKAPMDAILSSDAFSVNPPDLSLAGILYNEKFLINFIQDPAKYAQVKKHAMPPSASSAQDATDIVAYLKSIAPKEINNKDAFKIACGRCHSVKSDNLTQIGTYPNNDHELVNFKENLKRYQKNLINYKGKLPPDLSTIVKEKSSDYLEKFINNPKNQLPNTTMPRLGLTKESYMKIKSYLDEIGNKSYNLNKNLTTQQKYKKGLVYWNKKDHIKAKALFKEACDEGNMFACANLSVFYRLGFGGEKNHLEAVKYGKMACDKGIIRGCETIALAYLKGRGGIKQDIKKAQEFFKKRCEAKSNYCKFYNKIKYFNSNEEYNEYLKQKNKNNYQYNALDKSIKSDNSNILLTNNSIDTNSNSLNSSGVEKFSNNQISLDINWRQEGNWVRVDVDAKNLFGNAKGGISISFPDLKDKDYSIRLISKRGAESSKAYSSGSKIWHRGLRRAIYSNDLLVEGWDNHWMKGDINIINFKVNVKDLKVLRFNIRSVLIKNRQEYILPQNGTVDQQGYPVKQIAIELEDFKNSSNDNNFKFDSKNSYIAKISNKDHYNSKGIRLTKAIDILRQDRANYSKYIRDDEDTYFDYFGLLSARNEMSKYAIKAIGISYDKLKNLIVYSNPVLKIEVKNKTLYVSLADKKFLKDYFLTKEEKISLLKQILNRKYIKKEPFTKNDIKPEIRNYLANVRFKGGITYTYENSCKKIYLNEYNCKFNQSTDDGEDESSISIYYKAIKKNNKIIFDKIEKYFMAD